MWINEQQQQKGTLPTLILDFLPPELWDNKLLQLKKKEKEFNDKKNNEYKKKQKINKWNHGSPQ
jgi:hypothetical protein